MSKAEYYERRARAHWKRHLPNALAELQKNGQADEFFRSLGESAEQRFVNLVSELSESLPKEFMPRLQASERNYRQADEIVLSEMILQPDSATQKAIDQGGYRD